MNEAVKAAKLAWGSGTGPTSDDDMLAAIRAADAARAVGDEEVARVMASGTWQAKMAAAETEMLVDFAALPKAYRDLWTRDMERALSALRAAGLKVVRDV